MPGQVTVPVVLVTGFLGAGKTTFINDLLARADGRRIAAIVNDFGSINIDAALLESRTDEVIGLRNGCICCSLQGDLLRTMKTVLGKSAPDLIVIEASGIADPAGVVQGLMDPVLFRAAALDSVICLVDVEDVLGDPARWNDPLWQAQVRGSDLIQLSKVTPGDARLSEVETRLAAMGRKPVFGLDGSAAEIGDLIGATVTRQTDAPSARTTQSRFATVEWTCPGAVSLPRFQGVIQTLAPQLLRAKGFLTLREKPGQTLLFQMVGRRASLVPATQDLPGCSLVLIGEAEGFEPDAALRLLDGLRAG